MSVTTGGAGELRFPVVESRARAEHFDPRLDCGRGRGAVRSGFPYTVFAPGGLKGYSRANIVDPPARHAGDTRPGREASTSVESRGIQRRRRSGRAVRQERIHRPRVHQSRLWGSRERSRCAGFRNGWLIQCARGFYNVLNHANLNHSVSGLRSRRQLFGFRPGDIRTERDPVDFSHAVAAGPDSAPDRDVAAPQVLTSVAAGRNNIHAIAT